MKDWTIEIRLTGGREINWVSVPVRAIYTERGDEPHFILAVTESAVALMRSLTEDDERLFAAWQEPE